MARPIEPTPILKGREAKIFEAKIQHDLKKTTRLVPTPKIEQARQAVMDYAAAQRKK